MGLAIDKVESLISQKMETAKMYRPTVIIMNEKLYQQWQQETMEADLAQSHGYVRSPDPKSYQGLSIITSKICNDIEIF